MEPKFCRDCEYFKEGVPMDCSAPENVSVDLVTGNPIHRRAGMLRQLDIIGCGEGARWFKEKVKVAS